MAINIFEMFGTIKADDKPAKSAIDNVVGYAKKQIALFLRPLEKWVVILRMLAKRFLQLVIN